MAECAPHSEDVPSLDLLAWVDEIADQFETAWRSLAPPQVADYVGDATGPRRVALLLELVKLDRAYRRRLGEERCVKDYLAAFPELRGLIPTAEDVPHPELGRSSSHVSFSTSQPSIGSIGPDPENGPRIRGYEVLDELGHGGMGVVYRARQLSLNRVVALKMILSGGYVGPQQRARFRTEAEAAACLQHPNIVSIYEVGEQDGQPYCAMEYIAGGNLGQRLGAIPQPPHQAARLVETLARAVQYAHEQGIVHRDLNPANVLLAGGPDLPLDQCLPKIADFGLAKQLPSHRPGQKAEVAAEPAYQTRTGEILGTPSYMAPEQASGKPAAIGPAADVYSLGAILYDCLTGRPPFRGQTTLDTLEQVRSQEPVSPSRLQPGLPRDLVTICLKTLAKAPGGRYASANELADDLRRFLDGRPIKARAVAPPEKLWRWCRRNPVVGGLSVASGLFLAAGFVISTYFAIAEKARALEAQNNAWKAEQSRIAALRESGLLALERGRNLAEQGDGCRGLLWLVRCLELATMAEDPELTRVVRTNLTAVSHGVHQLRQVLPVGPAPGRCALTPDGKTVWAGSWQKREVRPWDIATGQPGPELPLDQAAPPIRALSQDGKLLLTGDGLQFRLWDCATRRPRDPRLQPPEALQPPEGICSASFRPDGRVLATGHDSGGAYLWDVATGQIRARLSGHQAAVLGVAFSPDGQTLATGSIDDVLQLWDAETGQPKGKLHNHRGQVFALTWSRDGQTILTGNAHGTIHFWDVATGQRQGPPLLHRLTVCSIDISSDGGIVATGSGDRTARLWDASSHQPLGNLLPHQGTVSTVALGPKGTTLVTASEEGLVRIRELARGAVKLPHRSWVYAVSFSPDGSTALTGCGDQTARLWEVRTGRALGPPLEHGEEVRAVAFRPDGRGFFTGTFGGHLRRWAVPPASPGDRIATQSEGITALAVSPDGRTMAAGSLDRSARLWDLAAGRWQGDPLKHEGEVTAVAFSPDGSTVLTGSKDKTARLWDVATGQSRGAPLVHPDEVVAVAFHPDARRIFTASRDTGVHVWDATTGQPIGRTLPLLQALSSMALSPDGQRILLGSQQGMAQLFDLGTALPLGDPVSHEHAVRAVAFSPDGRTALTAGQDPFARLWVVPAPLVGDLERIRLWSQVITGLELKEDGIVSVLDAPTWRDRRQRLQILGGSPVPGDLTGSGG
jgi:WD40 repeat protein/serine/threonine protein kinase